VEEQHASALTREETTSAVHFIRFQIPVELRERFRNERVAVASTHAAYEHEQVLSEETKRSLTEDLVTS